MPSQSKFTVWEIGSKVQGVECIKLRGWEAKVEELGCWRAVQILGLRDNGLGLWEFGFGYSSRAYWVQGCRVMG